MAEPGPMTRDAASAALGILPSGWLMWTSPTCGAEPPSKAPVSPAEPTGLALSPDGKRLYVTIKEMLLKEKRHGNVSRLSPQEIDDLAEFVLSL
jgi:hypothetical protein